MPEQSKFNNHEILGILQQLVNKSGEFLAAWQKLFPMKSVTDEMLVEVVRSSVEDIAGELRLIRRSIGTKKEKE